MRIINYNYGYQFDCVIKGRIILNGVPELDLVKQLLKDMPIDQSYPWIKALAIERVNQIKDGRFCLGVTPTEYIVKKLNLRKYKTGINYMFTVV